MEITRESRRWRWKSTGPPTTYMAKTLMNDRAVHHGIDSFLLLTAILPLTLCEHLRKSISKPTIFSSTIFSPVQNRGGILLLHFEVYVYMCVAITTSLEVIWLLYWYIYHSCLMLMLVMTYSAIWGANAFTCSKTYFVTKTHKYMLVVKLPCWRIILLTWNKGDM